MKTDIKPDQVQQILKGNNVTFEMKPIQHGAQFAFEDGAKLNSYDSGTRNWCGNTKASSVAQVDSLLGDDANVSSGPAVAEPSLVNKATNRVFIVYGHDAEARNHLELMLRRFKLEPVVLQNMPSGGQTIIEQLEGVSDVTFAIVLLTPDDVGNTKDQSENLNPRARQNVVLELGMFLASLGRKRVAILHKGNLELPSDINGLLYIPFNESVDEIKERVAAELQEAGFDIHIKDLLS